MRDVRAFLLACPDHLSKDVTEAYPFERIKDIMTAFAEKHRKEMGRAPTVNEVIAALNQHPSLRGYEFEPLLDREDLGRSEWTGIPDCSTGDRFSVPTPDTYPTENETYEQLEAAVDTIKRMRQSHMWPSKEVIERLRWKHNWSKKKTSHVINTWHEEFYLDEEDGGSETE